MPRKGVSPMSKRVLCALLAAVLAAVLMPAAAETCLIPDVTAAAAGIETSSSYIALQVPVAAPADVMLTITGEDGVCIYQRAFGLQEESFRTEDIFLKLQGTETLYTVTLQVGESSWKIPVRRVAGTLQNQPACGAGIPLDEITGFGSWQCVTVLSLAEGSKSVPLLAAAGYKAGTLSCTLTGSTLTVEPVMTCGQLERGRIYVATDALTARELGRPFFSGIVGEPGQPIDLGDAAYVMIFADLRVTLSPRQAEPMDSCRVEGQDELWEAMQENTVNEAVG